MMSLARGGLQWSGFLHGRANCFLDTVEHVSDMSTVRSGLYAFAQLKSEVICAAPCRALSDAVMRLLIESVFVYQKCLSLIFDDRVHVSKKALNQS